MSETIVVTDPNANEVIVTDDGATVISFGIDDKTFAHAFTNANIVSVAHHLNKHPAVTVVDSAGNEVEVDVHYIDLNNLTVSFGASFSGSVYCN